AARLPAAPTAAGVAARLDLPAARGIVAQHGGRFRFLGLLVDGLRVGRRLGRVQRGGRCGRRRRCCGGAGAFVRLLLGFLALPFLLLAQLGGLQLRQLLLATSFLFTELQLFGVDRRGRRWRRRRRRLGSDGRGGHFRRVALHEDAFLPHLDLHRAELAGGVRLANLARLLARERDLVLGFRGAVGLAQVFEQARLVLLAQRIVGLLLVDSRGAQLLEQDRRRHLQLGRELGNAGLRHYAASLVLAGFWAPEASVNQCA